MFSNNNISYINEALINNEFGYVKIKQFDCGCNHVGCLTNNNILYMIGNNDYCQCWYNNISKFKIPIPFQINLSNNETIINVKCGNDYTIIKTINDQYYGFGKNNKTQLFIKFGDIINIPSLISINYIKKLTNCYNEIIDIIPSYDTSYILQIST